MVVGSFTGVNICRGDADYIGNAQDAFLLRYDKSMAQARKAYEMQIVRARGKGKQLPSNHGERLRELKQQRYNKCRFGGLPRDVITADAVHARSVPVKRIEHADELNEKLHHEMAELRAKGSHQKLETSHMLQALCAAVEKEQAARVEAEKAAAIAMEERDRSAADSERAVRASRQRVCASRTECSQAETKVLKLGGQVGAAHMEQARVMEREAKVREQMDELRQETDRLRQEVEVAASDMSAKTKSEMHCSVKELKERLRHAEMERTKAQAQVMKMGRHVSTAHIEQAKARELKEQVSNEAKQAAARAAQRQAEA